MGEEYPIDVMARLTLSTPTAFALCLGLLVSCQSSSSAPVVLSGDDAHHAYVEWLDGLSPELSYPVQIHIDYMINMHMDLGEISEPMFVNMNLGMDCVSDDAERIRSWGNMAFDMKLEGEQQTFDLDFQIANDDDGLRLLLDDHGFLGSEAGFDLPPAYTLSKDRLDILIGMYAELVEETMSFYGPDFVAMWSEVSGAGQLMHPVNFIHMMGAVDSFVIFGWHAEDGEVKILARLKEGFMENAMDSSFGSLGLPFDASIFDDFTFEMLVDQATGALLDYQFDFALPMEVPVPEIPGGVLKMDMGLKIGFNSLPVVAGTPAVTLPDASHVMVLDSYFDQFLPALEMALDMQRQQMRGMAGEQDADDDFSF